MYPHASSPIHQVLLGSWERGSFPCVEPAYLYTPECILGGAMTSALFCNRKIDIQDIAQQNVTFSGDLQACFWRSQLGFEDKYKRLRGRTWEAAARRMETRKKQGDGRGRLVSLCPTGFLLHPSLLLCPLEDSPL